MDEQSCADEPELSEPRPLLELSPDERRDLQGRLGRQVALDELPPTVRTLVNLHRRGRVIR